MARPTGLEPVTYDLEGRCSIQLSYGRANKTPVKDVLEKSSPDVCAAHHLYLVNRSAKSTVFTQYFVMETDCAEVAGTGWSKRHRSIHHFMNRRESVPWDKHAQPPPMSFDGDGQRFVIDLKFGQRRRNGFTVYGRYGQTGSAPDNDDPIFERHASFGHSRILFEKPEGHANQSGVRLFNLLPLAVRGLRILPAATGGGPSAKITQFP